MARIRVSPLASSTILLLFAAMAGEASAAECPADSEVVNININNHTISIDRENVTIKMNGGGGYKPKVCWLIDGLATGQELHFFRKIEQTPEEGYFPNLNKKVKGESYKQKKRVGVPAKHGEWHYGLKLMEGTRRVTRLDPVVIILEGADLHGLEQLQQQRPKR